MINRFLDALPRSRLFREACERPSFRSLGVAGYHVALIATFGAGLVAGRSLLVLAAVAAICAVSFFGWAYLRRAFTGRETFVLLEHVWAAELASTGVLYLLREPIFPYLDVVGIGLAVFLAFGRVGCLLAGCCHGHPSTVGVRYGEEHARDGFPAHLVGVRLFPVQALEAAGLAGIGLGGLAFVAGATPGSAFAWFLTAYAVLRFGLEGLRADERPHVLGLSQARWMAIVELGAAFAITERGQPLTQGRAAAALLVAAVLLASLVIARRLDPRPRLLRPAHLAQIRALVRAAVERAEATRGSPVPEVARTAQWVSVAVSLVGDGGAAHVSIALPLDRVDLRLLCDVAAGALPEIEPGAARTAPAALLHVRVPLPLAEAPSIASPGLADALHGAALRRRQASDTDAGSRPSSGEPVSSVQPEAEPAAPVAPGPSPVPRATSERPVPSPPSAGTSPWDPQMPAAMDEARAWRRVPTNGKEETFGSGEA